MPILAPVMRATRPWLEEEWFKLKELGGVGLVGMAQGKHFAMHDALASGEPLNVTWAKAGGGTQRIGVIDMPLAHDGDCLEAAVRVRGKTWDGHAVVHAPAILTCKVLAKVAPGQRNRWPHGCITLRVVV